MSNTTINPYEEPDSEPQREHRVEDETTDESWAKLLAEHPPMPGVKFGILDTVDNVWIGDPVKGPNVYEDGMVNGKMMPGSLLARIAAELWDTRNNHPPKRTIAVPFNERGPFLKRDDVTPPRSFEEALEGRESGRLI